MRIMKALTGVQVEPRQYQLRITSKVVDMFAGDHINKAGHKVQSAGSVMIESPTGSGKTCMGMGVAKYIQSNPAEFGADEVSLVWVAMRRNLLQQASDENRERGFNSKIDFVSMFAKEVDERLTDRTPGHKVMMVVDECLAGETLVPVRDGLREFSASIADIVNGMVGTEALSYNHATGMEEWKPIVSRTCTGEREVYEVEVELDDGSTVIVGPTDNHRFFDADTGEYIRVDNLTVGATVIISKDHVVNHSVQKDAQHDADQQVAVSETH